ncbi:YbgA family protein [Shewanella sp. GXUN23E]|uniref:YbgA family protein n=1 Tax=Shewanella sp. GXUN23E TaxID=3422498 RepID=UPI003D7DB754
MTGFDPKTIKIGISACLLGQNVRFDGGHKRSAYCTDELQRFFEFQPICPEMAIGLGAPRKSIRQVRHGDEILLQSADGSLDVTEPMMAFCRDTLPQLAHLGGYLLCAKSPSCGMERVLEYAPGSNNAGKTGTGVFARALMSRYPELPVEETGRLHDMVLRENFFTRVYAYHDWQTLRSEGLTRHKLVQFHSRYKYLLMAHHPHNYRLLGPMIANPDDDIERQAQAYFSLFMATLKHHATRRNHTSTLQHIQGYFKKMLSKAQKAELSDAILEYREGLQPLLVPITLINHYLREFPNPYIQEQVYLKPHPQELKLRYGY